MASTNGLVSFRLMKKNIIQPADSFFIQKIKVAWRVRWEAYKVELFRKTLPRETYVTKPGCLPNHGDRFFLKLAANAVREANNQKDQEEIHYAIKAIIRCGLALNTTRIWEIRQLFPHLQNNIAKYREKFNGNDLNVEWSKRI